MELNLTFCFIKYHEVSFEVNRKTTTRCPVPMHKQNTLLHLKFKDGESAVKYVRVVLVQSEKKRLKLHLQ